MRPENITHLKQARKQQSSGHVRHCSSGPAPSFSARKTGELARIITAGQLGAALFAHFDSGEPRVPVQPTITATMCDLLQDLRSGKAIESPPAYFLEILPGIYWDAVPPDAERCGLRLLMCLGSLSEAMHHHQQYCLPASRAALILLDFYKGRDLRFTRRRGNGGCAAHRSTNSDTGPRCGCGCRTLRWSIP
jgi:hypothetical protein